MDEQRAYKILDLKPPVSKLQAKKAYRGLAKKYHPDVCATQKKTKYADLKMKQINLAFRFLLPRLPDEVVVEPEPVKKEKRKSSSQVFYTDMAEALVSWFKKMFRSVAVLFEQDLSDHDIRSSAVFSKNKTKHSQRGFDEILKTCASGTASANRSTTHKFARRRQTAVYQRYRNYLGQQRQQRAFSVTRSGLSPVEPVGKIEPISPVSPIAKR